MSRLSPLDLSFLAMESPARPMHAGVVLVFGPPANGNPEETVERTVAAFRATPPAGSPWNVRPVVGPTSLPHWETVAEVDLDYHVRRVALPAPGSDEQLMELVSHLYPAMLDRSRPLWEAYVIEGLEGGRMAVFIKGHHALLDGASGVGLFHASLSEEPNDTPRPLWAVTPSPRKKQPTQSTGGIPLLGTALRGAAGLARAVPGVARLAPDVISLARAGAAPFSAARTPVMGERITPARSFAALELPLDEVKRIGKQAGGTVNDVVLSVCDDAMHRHVKAAGCESERMVSSMAVSIRREGDESGSNAVTGALVGLGAPDAAPEERLAQVVAATARIKSEIRGASSLPLQLQMLSLMASLELREQLPIARTTIPQLSNFVVSNIAGGSTTPLYLGRAKLDGFYVNPIVSAGQAANFTLLSYNGSLCIGLGAARNVIPDTPRLADLVLTSFEELQTRTSERPSRALRREPYSSPLGA